MEGTPLNRYLPLCLANPKHVMETNLAQETEQKCFAICLKVNDLLNGSAIVFSPYKRQYVLELSSFFDMSHVIQTCESKKE